MSHAYSHTHTRMLPPDFDRKAYAAAAALCTLRAGDYSKSTPEVRAAALARFREKKKRRIAATTIRYKVRQALAEQRPRNRGRFVKRGAAQSKPPPPPFPPLPSIPHSPSAEVGDVS